ncbi:MAG TPA: thioesterase family protein [Chthoniobacterales bacterium]|nr:thioesterase family protein [Chthoniobacterales bacterium]
MKPPQISLEKILALDAVCLRMTVPEAYQDENGHMNVRWYAAIFDEAGDTLHVRLGLTAEFHKAHGTGTMDLENHINYLNEVRPGDRLAIFSRLLDYSAKRIHYLMFMVDETRGSLSAIFECINAFADLKLRRTAPFPPQIATRIEAEVAASSKLDWPPPICGVMHA